MNEPTNPFAPPQAVVGDVQPAATVNRIDSLAVSAGWKTKFRLIEKAGGVKLPKFRDLSFGERMRTNFNILAFLFGPIYYAVKGMWKKGLAMFGIAFVAVLVLSFILGMLGMESLANALGYGVAAIFAVRANIDYYKKMVLDDNGWL